MNHIRRLLATLAPSTALVVLTTEVANAGLAMNHSHPVR